MSINNVDDLLAALRRVQILDADQVDEVERELGPVYKNPRALADYLAQIDWLTPYQVRTLFEGDWDELVLGPFILLTRLGEGGLCQVYKAWDTDHGRTVAVKVLRSNLAERPEALRQFQCEMHTMAQLSHPNIIKTFAADHVGQRHYFAMEFVDGIDLDQFVKQSGPLPVEQACDFIRQAAQGLQHAHQLNLVHRDVKPANLFLIHPPVQGKQLKPGLPPPKRTGEPAVKILDWGLARLHLEEENKATDEANDSVDSDEEKARLIGTADYIAPEQTCDPTIVDIRADIYSLGCTFFYLLTGEPPFGSLPLMQKVLAHRENPMPNLRDLRPDVPPEVEHIVQKMMAKAPQDRYQIPLLLVAPLRHFCAGTSALVGGLIRPPSTLCMSRPSTAIHLPRPASSLSLDSGSIGSRSQTRTDRSPGDRSSGSRS